jgi:hypothetical protein
LRCAGGMELSARVGGPRSHDGRFAFEAQNLVTLEHE